jgi:hypothetical protein
MKIIITESQYKVILENEENEENKLLGKIMYLIESFDETNINMAFEIAKGFKIKPSTILEQYKELFEVFNYKPTIGNLKKIISNELDLNVEINLSKKTLDLIFNLPKLQTIYFFRLNDGDLDDLDSTNKQLYFTSHCKITSIPNLKEVGGLSISFSKIESLPNLKETAGGLDISFSNIESLPNLISVGRNFSLNGTPLGEKLKSKMSEDEIKNKFGVKGELYI